MVEAPLYLLFAGINGAGKSTLYRSGLWSTDDIPVDLPRINSDEILASRGWDWSDARAQIAAGKEAVKLIRIYFRERKSFNQETTLTGHAIMRNIAYAREIGYRVVMHYVGVESPAIANRRIAHRIEQGGHGIAPEVVARRARESFDHLIEAVSLCDEVFLFDNTFLLKPVARFFRADLMRYDLETFGITWPDEVIRRLTARS